MRYILSSLARLDLKDIVVYIAQDDIKAARRVKESILQAVQRLCSYPYLGQPRRDLTEMPVLLYATSGYWIVYEIHSEHLEILRVLSQSRNIPHFLHY